MRILPVGDNDWQDVAMHSSRGKLRLEGTAHTDNRRDGKAQAGRHRPRQKAARQRATSHATDSIIDAHNRSAATSRLKRGEQLEGGLGSETNTDSERLDVTRYIRPKKRSEGRLAEVTSTNSVQYTRTHAKDHGTGPETVKRVKPSAAPVSPIAATEHRSSNGWERSEGGLATVTSATANQRQVTQRTNENLRGTSENRRVRRALSYGRHRGDGQSRSSQQKARRNRTTWAIQEASEKNTRSNKHRRQTA
eukprot:6195253-Pleurochrysis_carterae.AAC.5